MQRCQSRGDFNVFVKFQHNQLTGPITWRWESSKVIWCSDLTLAQVNDNNDVR